MSENIENNFDKQIVQITLAFNISKDKQIMKIVKSCKCNFFMKRRFIVFERDHFFEFSTAKFYLEN